MCLRKSLSDFLDLRRRGTFSQLGSSEEAVGSKKRSVHSWEEMQAENIGFEWKELLFY